MDDLEKDSWHPRRNRSSPHPPQPRLSPVAGSWTTSGESAWMPCTPTCWRTALSSLLSRASARRALASRPCSRSCFRPSRASLAKDKVLARPRFPVAGSPTPAWEAFRLASVVTPAFLAAWVAASRALVLVLVDRTARTRTRASRHPCKFTQRSPSWRGRHHPRVSTSASPAWTACCSWMPSRCSTARHHPRPSCGRSFTC
mmetsp:Transcript_80269/g.221984  ORF Transcript_80269/g.221984 Transcript_80269/m.221984 type:complete len:201 (-) Transcript_80269:698-1300(-)